MEDSKDMTARNHSVQHGFLRIKEVLLAAGVDIKAKSDAFGNGWVRRTEASRTPLIWAVAGRDCLRVSEHMCRL